MSGTATIKEFLRQKYEWQTLDAIKDCLLKHDKNLEPNSIYFICYQLCSKFDSSFEAMKTHAGMAYRYKYGYLERVSSILSNIDDFDNKLGIWIDDFELSAGAMVLMGKNPIVPSSFNNIGSVAKILKYRSLVGKDWIVKILKYKRSTRENQLRRGRPVGFTVSGQPAMIAKTKTWSQNALDWEWLESHPNQSEVLRQAIAYYRQLCLK